MSLLQGPSAKQLEVIKQELGEGPGDVERGVRDLQSMCAASPHLPHPENIDVNLLKLFVRGCRMDLDRARAKFAAFWASRARNSDLYEHRSLTEPPLSHVCNFIDIVPLPKLSDEGLRVTIFRVREGYLEAYADVAATVRAILLVSDVRMHDETVILGDAFIWELSPVRGSMVGRLAAATSAIRRGIQLAHAAYPQRLKRNHIVAAPPFFASSLHLMRSCTSDKIKRRFLIHSKVDDLLDHYPARILPAEWGGEEESIDVLAKKWRHRVEEVRDYLRTLDELSNTTSEHTLDNDIYGTVGAFRKLDID